MERDPLEYTELAWRILNNSTPYKVAKQTIRSIFESSFSLPRQEQFGLRLTVIDSYYSTNMNRRYYGIEDIADALTNIGEADDDISVFFKDYIKNPLSHREGNELLYRKYGISKAGYPSKRAQSLISKYAYFHTSFQFPIYDSLAKSSYEILSDVFSDVVKPCSKINDAKYFFDAIAILNEKVRSFDKLDNLLWLIGKVKEGNLSLIMKRENYKCLMEAVDHVPLNDKSLVELSKQNKTKSIIGKDLCDFVSFVETLGK